jgi:ubiquinone/menaquinone biosynthesis C-methylase UbiE
MTEMSDFDAFAEEYDFFKRTLGLRSYDEILSFIPRAANRALDAGCGSGVLTSRLAGHVNCVVGMDISNSMIALAKQHQTQERRDNVNFVIADLESLPFGDEAFDFVVSLEVLHETRLELTLPHLRRLVKADGRMVVRDPVASNIPPAASLIREMLGTVKSAPALARAHGLRTMWRIVSFRLSPAWIRHLRHGRKLTPRAFQDTYSRLLPGCRFKNQRWAMTAIWDASGDG